MSHFQRSRTLHQFLFVWICLVYLWGLLHLSIPDVAAYKCWYGSAQPDTCPPLTILLSSMHLGQMVMFTLLVLLYGALLWANMAGRMPRRWHWFSFFLQAGCVFVASLVVRQDNMVLSLYLVLTLEAIGMLQNARFAIIVASSSLILFILNEFLSRGLLNRWAATLLSMWISNDYPALILFLVGYLMLYLQLSGAHVQLETTHIELAEAHEGLAAAASQIETLTRLTERQRLARDLHDTLSQGLVGLKLQLEAVDALLIQHAHDQAQEVVRQAMSRVQETLMQARRAIDDLRSRGTMKQNCAEAAQEMVQSFTLATGIPCHTDLNMLAALPPAFHEHILRVIGEGLTNIARHAQARQAWIHATQMGDILSIEVRDDGIGFDLMTVTKQSGHYGLLGLRERARLIGGHVEILSAPGSGTSIRFSLPCQQEHTLHTAKEQMTTGDGT